MNAKPEKIRVMPQSKDDYSADADVEVLKSRLHAAEQDITELAQKVDNLRMWQAYVLGAVAAGSAIVGAGCALWSRS